MGMPWVVRDDGIAPETMRVLCLPYAGGGAGAYASWDSAFKFGVILPVRLPGREGRISEPLPEHLTELVDQLATAVVPHLGERYAIFGHSMGAVVGLELARRLEAAGRPPARLLVSGRAAPQVAASTPNVLGLPDDAILDAVRALGGPTTSLLDDEEVRQVFLPIIRADLTLVAQHVVELEPRLSCPISVYYGVDDGGGRADAMPWRDLTTNTWSCRGFPGGHFFAFGQATVALLATIARDLALSTS